VELSDQQKINASRQQVFAALNDAEILRQCIPGCETLDKLSDTEMTATVVLRVGPVKAKFSGAVTLSNINPPNGYTITGEGKGGAAGFAKGGADIELLEESDGSTTLKYDVKVNIGGKIAQLGSRLMESTSRKLAGQFFDKFAEILEAQNPQSEVESSDTHKPEEKVEDAIPADSKSKKRLLILAICGAAIVIWYFYSN
jgi:uncharacterized protein